MILLGKGYKRVSLDMIASCGNGIQFEIGKEYTINEPLLYAFSGYHLATRMEDTLIYYNLDSRLFEVEYDICNFKIMVLDAGESIGICSSTIKLIREITEDEFIHNIHKEVVINHVNRNVKLRLIDKGYFVDDFIKDKDEKVRNKALKMKRSLLYDKM